MRVKVEKEKLNGWTRWVPVIMQGYKMACCDCGLVHDFNFKVVKVTKIHSDGTWDWKEVKGDYRIMAQARRNNRSTGQMRRYKK